MSKLLILLATLAHLAPLPFGISPVGATALYAGAYGTLRFSWAIPMLLLLVGNFVFGFYDIRVLAFVYVGFALSTFAGRWFLRERRGYTRYSKAVASGAVIFFLLSNFAVWWVGYYPPTITGLLQCYVRGLPYLGQAILVDAAFCFMLFGLHQLIERRKAVVAIA